MNIIFLKNNRKNSGQLIVALVLTTALLISTMLLWNFNYNIMRSNQLGTSESVARMIAETIFTRVKSVIGSENFTT